MSKIVNKIFAKNPKPEKNLANQIVTRTPDVRDLFFFARLMACATNLKAVLDRQWKTGSELVSEELSGKIWSIYGEIRKFL